MDFGYEDEELLDGKECTTMASAWEGRPSQYSILYDVHEHLLIFYVIKLYFNLF